MPEGLTVGTLATFDNTPNFGFSQAVIELDESTVVLAYSTGNDNLALRLATNGGSTLSPVEVMTFDPWTTGGGSAFRSLIWRGSPTRLWVAGDDVRRVIEVSPTAPHFSLGAVATGLVPPNEQLMSGVALTPDVSIFWKRNQFSGIMRVEVLAVTGGAIGYSDQMTTFWLLSMARLTNSTFLALAYDTTISELVLVVGTVAGGFITFGSPTVVPGWANVDTGLQTQNVVWRRGLQPTSAGDFVVTLTQRNTFGIHAFRCTMVGSTPTITTPISAIPIGPLGDEQIVGCAWNDDLNALFALTWEYSTLPINGRLFQFGSGGVLAETASATYNNDYAYNQDRFKWSNWAPIGNSILGLQMGANDYNFWQYLRFTFTPEPPPPTADYSASGATIQRSSHRRIEMPLASAISAPRPAATGGSVDQYFTTTYGSIGYKGAYGPGSFATGFIKDMAFDAAGNCYVIVDGPGNIGGTWSGCLVIHPDHTVTYLWDDCDPRWQFPGGTHDGPAPFYTDPTLVPGYQAGMDDYYWFPRGVTGSGIYRTNPRLEELVREEAASSPTNGSANNSRYWYPTAICVGADDELYVYCNVWPFNAIYRVDKTEGVIAEVCYFSPIPWYSGHNSNMNSRVSTDYDPFFGRASDGSFIHGFSTNDINDAFGSRAYIWYRMSGPGIRYNNQALAPGTTPLDYDDTLDEDYSDAHGQMGYEFVMGDHEKGLAHYGQEYATGLDFRGAIPYGAQFNIADDRMYATEFGNFIYSFAHDGSDIQIHYDGYDRQWAEGVHEGPVGTAAPGYLHAMGVSGTKIFAWWDTYNDADQLGVIDTAAVAPELRWIAGSGSQLPYDKQGPARLSSTWNTFWYSKAGPGGQVAVTGDPPPFGADRQNKYIQILRPNTPIDTLPNAIDDYCFLTPTFVGYSITHATTGTTMTVAAPPGIQTGDVMMAYLLIANVNATGSGQGEYWDPSFPVTYSSTGFLLRCLQRERYAGDPANYTFSVGPNNAAKTIVIVAYRNVENYVAGAGWSTGNTNNAMWSPKIDNFRRPSKVAVFFKQNYTAGAAWSVTPPANQLEIVKTTAGIGGANFTMGIWLSTVMYDRMVDKPDEYFTSNSSSASWLATSATINSKRC